MLQEDIVAKRAPPQQAPFPEFSESVPCSDKEDRVSEEAADERQEDSALQPGTPSAAATFLEGLGRGVNLDPMTLHLLDYGASISTSPAAVARTSAPSPRALARVRRHIANCSCSRLSSISLPARPRPRHAADFAGFASHGVGHALQSVERAVIVVAALLDPSSTANNRRLLRSPQTPEDAQSHEACFQRLRCRREAGSNSPIFTLSAPRSASKGTLSSP